MKKPVSMVLLVAVLGLCLVAFPPFLATLELHHALGAADEDGHQHSTADLCSWVQSHASSSTVDCSPVLVSQAASSVPDVSRGDLVAAYLFPIDLPARAPPASLM